MNTLTDEEVRTRLNKIKTDFLALPNLEPYPKGTTDLVILTRAVTEEQTPLLLRALKTFPDFKADVNSKDQYGRTPLMIAIFKDKDIAIELLNQGANPMVKDKNNYIVAQHLEHSPLSHEEKMEILEKILGILYKQPAKDIANLIATEKTPFSKLSETAIQTIGSFLTGKPGNLRQQQSKLKEEYTKITAGSKRKTSKRKSKRKYTKRRRV